MSTHVHETAVIALGAELDQNVLVGPYAVVGAGVRVGSGTKIGAHCVLEGPTWIGAECCISAFASIGSAAQVRGEEAGPEARLEVGRGNIIREFTTLNRGTVAGGGVTRIGDDNLIMAYVHIAHDCWIGDRVVLANNVALAGHVVVENDAVLGGLSAVQQFARIGRLAFLAGGARVDRDVPPFTRVSGDRAKLWGLNQVGLRRQKLDAKHIKGLRDAYRRLFRTGAVVSEVAPVLRAQHSEIPEVIELLDFIDKSERGICR